MCGIVAIQGVGPVAEELVLALAALQHRGQDAAGVLTFDGRFRLHKGQGLATQVFAKPEDVARLTGKVGLGHVRYATQGSLDWLDAQPFQTSYPFGIGMVHNGNVVNFKQIRTRIEHEQERLLETANDVELLVHVLVKRLEEQGVSKFSPDVLFRAVAGLTDQVDGAYSALALIAHRGLVAFRDRHGIRPLLWGQKKTADGVVHLFASESTVFDVLDFTDYRDLLPGEIVYIEKDGTAHTHRIAPKRQAFCSFEYIYFAREDSTLEGRTVASERVAMGKLLAQAVRARGLQPDCVIDVPNSAYFAASGLAEELGVPYRRGLAKNNHVGRSFILPSQAAREKMVVQKLNPIREVVEGKKLCVVDDSIVRGTTSKRIVGMLRQAGAAEIYLVSAAPPVRHPCVYGIDIAERRELVAASRTEDEILAYVGADALVYPDLDAFRARYEVDGEKRGCFACFDGNYPTHVPPGVSESKEREPLVVDSAASLPVA